MTRINYSQSGLTALLDALERELLAAPAAEVRDAWRETGRARNIVCEKVRALLDALERELLATHVDEVRDAWRAAGRARTIACQEVRALLNEAFAASEDGPAAALQPDTCTGLDRPLGISRDLRPAVRYHPRASAFPAWSYRRH